MVTINYLNLNKLYRVKSHLIGRTDHKNGTRAKQGGPGLFSI